MLIKSINSGILAILIFSSIASADTPTTAMSALVTLCDINPNCSHEPLTGSGGIAFRVREKDQVKRVMCQSDGKCIMVLPRGKQITVTDIVTQLTPNDFPL